jgi:hypothetical protein
VEHRLPRVRARAGGGGAGLGAGGVSGSAGLISRGRDERADDRQPVMIATA